jgi:hypothetical protein
MLRLNPIVRLLGMLSGFLLWGAQFTVVYMISSIVCAKGHAAPVILGFDIGSLGVIVTTLVSLLATGLVLAVVQYRPGPIVSPADRFLHQGTVLIAGTSLFAIAWTGLPALMVPTCG